MRQLEARGKSDRVLSGVSKKTSLNLITTNTEKANIPRNPIMHPSFVPYRVAGAYIAQRLEREGIENPEVGIICGSGLSELNTTLEGKTLTVRPLSIRNHLTRLDICSHRPFSHSL